MRVSCNGCRILRKGCSENCTIRPCLEWIKSPESQANATVFLAKFYGRAGLLNLINAGPDHLRPAIFRSLLYEASGRIVNPMYGSVGLLWSGRWQVCQSAVEAILRGDPIKQIPAEGDIKLNPSGLHKAFSYDIRHVSKDSDLKRVNKTTRARFKRPGKLATDSSIVPWRHAAEYWGKNTPSLESVTGSVAAEERRKAIMLSMETTEASTVGSQSEVDLELTLGYESVPHRHSPFRGSSSSSSS